MFSAMSMDPDAPAALLGRGGLFCDGFELENLGLSRAGLFLRSGWIGRSGGFVAIDVNLRVCTSWRTLKPGTLKARDYRPPISAPGVRAEVADTALIAEGVHFFGHRDRHLSGDAQGRLKGAGGRNRPPIRRAATSTIAQANYAALQNRRIGCRWVSYSAITW